MKKITVIILAVFLSLFFAGCNLIKKDEQGAVGDDVLAEIDLTADEEFSGTLNISCTSEESEKNIIDALIKGFSEKYPYITVNKTTYNLDSYYGTMINNAGYAYQENDYTKMSDVFWLAQDKIDYLYDSDILFPLTSIDNIDDNFNFDNLVENAVEVSSTNNIIYMMPRDYNEVVMYYNEAIFDAAGVSYPANMMTQSDFLQMLLNLKTGLENSLETNDYGVAYSTACQYLIDVNSCWDSWCWPLIKSFGGEIVNDLGEAKLDSDETFNAVSFWKTLLDSKYIEKCTTTNSTVNFRMQQSAICFHSRAILSNLVSSTKQIKGVKKLGVCSIPKFGTEYAIGGGSSGYGMYKYAVNKTASWLFLKYVVSEEGQNAFSATGNCVPSLKSLLNDTTASWYTYTNENLGTSFNPASFIYGYKNSPEAFTSTRDYFKFIDQSIQTSVTGCIQACFSALDNKPSSDIIKSTITNQNALIDYYISSSKKG
jgi:multiple sugar transport system substrate-binding protein